MAKKMLDKESKRSGNCIVVWDGDDKFEVRQVVTMENL